MIFMRVLPVLDLMGGQVVRGVAGRRRGYRPIVSRLCASSDPLDVARAFRALFELNDLYIADLGAIAGGDPAFALYADLKRGGFRLWIDAGVTELKRVHRLVDASVEQIIVGLETAAPAVLAEACRAFDGRIVFSLDLKGGVPLGEPGAWGNSDAETIAKKAVALGVRRMIVLDLAKVGIADGTGTEELCARLTAAHPELEVIAGGGVRDAADLRRLRDCGVRTVLLASALHDGRLTRTDWEEL
jgi:phosphoribosylformimino-5-aminoimidazole carboxamide ribotide isomerase